MEIDEKDRAVEVEGEDDQEESPDAVLARRLTELYIELDVRQHGFRKKMVI